MESLQKIKNARYILEINFDALQKKKIKNGPTIESSNSTPGYLLKINENSS